MPDHDVSAMGGGANDSAYAPFCCWAQELLAKHPDAALEGRPVVQSLAEVSSEVGVVSRMVVLQTDALQQLRAHVMSSEASTQRQLVEAQISANVSTRSGLEATKVTHPFRHTPQPRPRRAAGIIARGIVADTALLTPS